jgi:hypothetical protein
MIKRLGRFKILLINIWPTYDLPVRTEAGLSRRPGVLIKEEFIYIAKVH